MRLGIIYEASIGNNFIIGSSIQFEKRKKYYLHTLRNNSWSNSYVQDSFNKYGEENFKFRILQDNIPEDILEHVEDIWIGALCGRAEDDIGGMNIRDAYRPRWSQVSKDKISKAGKGKKISEEARLRNHSKRSKNMSDLFSIKIYQYSLNGEYIDEFNSLSSAGKLLGVSAANISVSAKDNGIKSSGRYLWSYKKVERLPAYNSNSGKHKIKIVYQYDLMGNFIKEWGSTILAGNTLGFNYKNISLVCKGNRKSAGGFKWSYEKLL